MLTKLITAAVGIAAAAIVLSPTASADATNLEVAGQGSHKSFFELARECFERGRTFEIHYATGLSDSSQAVLDSIREKKAAAKKAAATPAPAE